MTLNSMGQIALYLAVLVALVKPLGWYMARVYTKQPFGLDRVLGPIERLIYRLCGVRADAEMPWQGYAVAMLVFNMLGVLVVYTLQRIQDNLLLNPQSLGAITPDSAFNTAVSFATNTNWQGYAGEVTMSYFTQMVGLSVQNFVSAASGMATLVALIRGITRRSASTIGNFWGDLIRSILYVLLPLSLLLALLLVTQGVVQTFDAARTVPLIEPLSTADGAVVTEQVIPLGPAASQIAIKQLGTNGGGFFNANSAHPLENPNPFSNFLQMLAILLIPAAFCYTFGKMVDDTRQGWLILIVMLAIFTPLMVAGTLAEQAGTPQLAALGADLAAGDTQAGGNMEGKETRFGIVNSTIWAAATTAASNGSVNSMHDSYTPLGGLVPMFLIQLGEIIFGGVGSGLYGMLIFAIVAVFIAGLMVGRTPEYLGKKIESYEVKMAALVILIPAVTVLLSTALAVSTEAGRATIYNPDPAAHGFSEVLYAMSSMGNNNGSAFAGLGANNPFYNTIGGIAMWFGRYWIAIPVLAIAGSLAAKKLVPVGPGTLPTHTPLFALLLIGVVLIVGALTFIPALALGPIVEHLQMTR
jgi:potassium-transporting ATPase potassium-binding subunit